MRSSELSDWKTCLQIQLAITWSKKHNIKKFEICSKLTIKTLERRHWRRSGVLIVNFEHISHLVLVFLLLTLNRYKQSVTWFAEGLWIFVVLGLILSLPITPNIAQKMKFSFKNYLGKCDQIHSFLQIWSHLLKKSLIRNFIFCAVKNPKSYSSSSINSAIFRLNSLVPFYPQSLFKIHQVVSNLLIG